MFKLFVTLLRGRNADAADALTDTLACRSCANSCAFAPVVWKPPAALWRW